MRVGWQIKDAAPVLGVHPNKVTQSINPAFEKVAKLMIADPVATMRELLNAIDRTVVKQTGGEFASYEVNQRYLAQTGRLDRASLGFKRR
jgi:hypothetical protein